MADRDVLERMRDDWNRRAEEDAHYYVAFGARGQDEAAFQATAAEVLRALEPELMRLPPAPTRSRRALEIGCGPGRLLAPMSRHFGEIHGVDVSDRMICLARQRLREIPHAHAHHTTGSDLSLCAAASFDFVYSYAVFQHIPSREVVFNYLEECRRVLKPGGILRCQINGLPPGTEAPDTWQGVRIPAADVAAFTRQRDFQLLAIEGAGTQYMWTTWRKQPEGWRASLRAPAAPPARVRGFGNTWTGEPAVPASGRFASVSLWFERLPHHCDLNSLEVRIDGRPAIPTYIGPPLWDGVTQVNVNLPAGMRTGLLPLEIEWLEAPLCGPAWIRVIPPGPPVPRLEAVSDGVNLSSSRVIGSRLVKVTLEEITAPEQISAWVDGEPAETLGWFEVDPSTSRCEVNFRLPASTGPGAHEFIIRTGRRALPPVAIEVI